MILETRPMARAVVYLSSAIAGWWVSLPVATQVLLYVMVADIVSGVIRAGAQQRINSHCSWVGMMRKAGTLVAALLAILLERHIAQGTQIGSVVSLFFCGTEGISVLENLRALGVPIPPALAAILHNAKKAGEVSGDD